jgi:hypothetical protein
VLAPIKDDSALACIEIATEPVVVALPTGHPLSRGRLMLGVGIGSYREEFEALPPELKGGNRGVMLEESIAALRALFSRNCSEVSIGEGLWLCALI